VERQYGLLQLDMVPRAAARGLGLAGVWLPLFVGFGDSILVKRSGCVERLIVLNEPGT
jgi:hypothetical protein